MTSSPSGPAKTPTAALGASDRGPIVSAVANTSWEVGLAELFGTRLSVSQLTDTRDFATTIQHLNNVAPYQILMSESHAKSDLYTCLSKRFNVVLVARSQFNETRGGQLVEEIASDKIQARDVAARYLGRAAAAALISYVERLQGGTRFARGSLSVIVDPW